VECATWTGCCTRLITSIWAVTVIIIHVGKWYGEAPVETREVLVRGIQRCFWYVKQVIAWNQDMQVQTNIRRLQGHLARRWSNQGNFYQTL
jgi:hypothetical protein